MIYVNKKSKYIFSGAFFLVALFWGFITFWPQSGLAVTVDQAKDQIIMLSQQREVLEGGITENEDQLTYLNNQIQKTDQEIAQKQAELSTLEAELKKQQDYLRASLRAIYEDDQKSFFEKIFQSRSLSDFFNREEYHTLTRANLKEATDNVAKLKEEAGTKKKSLETLKNLSNLFKASIEQQKSEKVVELEKINAEEARIRDRFAEKFGKFVNTAYCKKENKYIKAKYSIFSFPVDCGYISQGFGMTEFAAIDRAYKGNIHNGFDVGVATGTEIKSIGKGTVHATGITPSGGWGNWVMVKMDKVVIEGREIEFYALYAHMITESLVKVGDRVETGTLVGWVGGTPYWAPHLHFSLFVTPSDWQDKKVGPYPGNVVDPLNFMDIPISTVGSDWDPSYRH